MDKKIIKKLFILLLIIVAIIIAIMICDNIDKFSFYNEDKDIDEKSKYEFDFGEPINLDSKYGDEDLEIRGTDSSSNYGYISELYDDSSMWENDGHLIVETAHGYITYSNEWINEGVATIIEEPDFGGIGRFVLQERILKVNYKYVDYDDVANYVEKMKEKGFTKDAKEEKNPLKGTYKYEALTEDEDVISIELKNKELLLQVAI